MLSAALLLASCTADDSPTSASDEPSTEEAAPTSVLAEPEPAPTPEESLRATSQALNAALADRDAESAWAHYSQRCKITMGEDIETFRVMMETHYDGRSPAIDSVTVRVNGSSGQVVTVDNDPAAPADSMEPRTWTFIDDRWQFDNC